jgi:hypothetical protein
MPVSRDQSGDMASRLPATRAKSVKKSHLIVSIMHSYFAPEVWPRDRQSEPSCSLTNESPASKKGTSSALRWIRRSLRCKLPAEDSFKVRAPGTWEIEWLILLRFSTPLEEE